METATKQISFPLLISIIAGFFTISGGLWHLGYWSTFKFNYFEYASLTDLFKSSFYLFLDRTWDFLGIIILTSGLSYFQYFYLIKIVDPSEIDKSSQLYKRMERNGRRLNRVLDAVIIISLIVTGIYIVLGWMLLYSLEILPFTISIGLIAIASRHKIAKKITENSLVSESLIIIALVYAVFNFFIGKSTANKVIDGIKFYGITSFQSSNRIWNKDVLGSPYIGYTSDYHFIYSGYYGVLLFKKDEVESFSVQSMNKFTYSKEHEFKSFEEIIEENNKFPITIDTNKTYYDPGLNLNIDSAFRRIVRETLIHQ